MKLKAKFDKGTLFSIILGIVCGTLLGMFTPNPFKKSEQKSNTPKVVIEESVNETTDNDRNVTITGNIPFKEDRFEEIGSIHTSDEKVLTIETYYADRLTEVVYYVNLMGVEKGDIVTSIAFPLLNVDGTPVTKSQFLRNKYRMY